MVRKTMTLGTLAAFGLAAAIVGAGDAGIAFACDKEAKSAAASSSDCSKATVTTASTQSAASCCAKGASKTATTAGSVHKAMIKSAVVAPGAAPALNTAAFAANMNGSTVTAGSASCCESKSAAAMAGGSCDKSAAAAKSAGLSHCDQSTQTAAVVTDLPYREDKRVVLTGTYECGHCGIGATADCTPMFKTADGKVYRLWDSNRVADLRDNNSAKTVEIATVVKKVEGVKYLDVKSYKLL
jgi:hypothetical protein